MSALLRRALGWNGFSERRNQVFRIDGRKTWFCLKSLPFQTASYGAILGGTGFSAGSPALSVLGGSGDFVGSPAGLAGGAPDSLLGAGALVDALAAA